MNAYFHCRMFSKFCTALVIALLVGLFVFCARRQPRPWRASSRTNKEEAKKNKVSTAKTGTQPSHPIADFAGEYTNPGYGTVKIAQNGQDLTIAFNQLEPYPFVRRALRHFCSA
jgi:hypothetical protein